MLWCRSDLNSGFQTTVDSHWVIIGKRRHRVFLIVFNRTLSIFAGDNNRRKSLNEFDIRPDLT